MPIGKREIAKDELRVLSQMNKNPIPSDAGIQAYLDCCTLKPFYSVAKGLGLFPSNVKKWADAKPERYAQMGLYAIGTGPRPKLYVNVSHFTQWALENAATRRYLVYHFDNEVVPVPKGAAVEDVLSSGQVYILNDLAKAGVIPKPFSTKDGMDTLISNAQGAVDPRSKIGLWFADKYQEWLVDPSTLLLFILEKYQLKTQKN